MSILRSFMLAAGLFAALAPGAAAAPDLRRMVSPIRSFKTTMTVTQVDMDELVKIRKDYAQSYRVKSSQVYYQYPDRVKIEGKVGPISVTYLILGDKKFIKYGPLRQEKNLVNDPGQKQGLLDFGILTPDQLNDYTWKYVRQEKGLHVYELRFRNIREDNSRRLIWVDPARKVVVRRLTYHQNRDNDLKMDLRYDRFQQVSPGVWVPTVIRVYNKQGRLGATSQLNGISINKPIAASVFKI